MRFELRMWVDSSSSHLTWGRDSFVQSKETSIRICQTSAMPAPQSAVALSEPVLCEMCGSDKRRIPKGKVCCRLRKEDGTHATRTNEWKAQNKGRLTADVEQQLDGGYRRTGTLHL